MESFMTLVLRLAAGIMAIQDPGTPVKMEDAMQWATAAAYHAQAAGLDPFELVGIARNESDFQVDNIGPDGLDCGITQTRVTYSQYTCRQLRRDTWIAFAEAAREMKENTEICKRIAPDDQPRCRLNAYNSGPRYARSGWAGNYWLRVTCFEEAARAGVRPRGDCRAVQNRGDIARLLRASSPPSPPLHVAKR
jgi:hypothetical protein